MWVGPFTVVLLPVQKNDFYSRFAADLPPAEVTKDIEKTSFKYNKLMCWVLYIERRSPPWWKWLTNSKSVALSVQDFSAA